MTAVNLRTSRRDEVVDELRRQILDGRRPAGAALRERAIAEELGVSRVPVREAFRQLESEGLLESRPSGGVCVATLDDREARTAHDVRLALELLAVQLTVERGDGAVGDELRRTLDVGRRAAAGDDEATLRRLNREFHDTLARGSGSTILASMLRAARNHAHRAGGLDSLGPRRSWDDHRAIVESILEGDATGACARMAEHLGAHRTAALAAATTTTDAG